MYEEFVRYRNFDLPLAAFYFIGLMKSRRFTSSEIACFADFRTGLILTFIEHFSSCSFQTAKSFAPLLAQKPLMDKCGDKPNGEARTEHNPKGQPFVKAYKSHEEKQNAR